MKMICYLFVLYLYCICSIAQEAAAGNASELSDHPSKLTGNSSFEFGRPKFVADLTPKPMIAGRFDCAEDGTIYTLVDGYAPNGEGNPNERLALLGIHPDGTVTSFAWHSVPGFTDISLPKSIFAGNGRIYVLVKGYLQPVQDGRASRNPLVLVFDKQGSLVGTVVLEQDLNPLVVGVFPSGDILLVSEDRLNHRMALDLVGSDGAHIRDLRLNDSDFLVRANETPAADRGASRYSPSLLIAMSKFYPIGDHLLLVPLETSGLPIVELGEQGVTRSVLPHLPSKMVLDAFASPTASSVMVRLGTIAETDTTGTDLQGKIASVGTYPSQRIAEFSLTDGSLLRQIDIGSDGVQPACEAKGTFRFLTSSPSLGGLDVVSAKLR